MPDTTAPTTTMETREFEFRLKDGDKGTIEGRAVPYDTPVVIGRWYTEVVARGAVEADDVPLFWQHREPIGKITSTRDRKDGFWITAKVSDTTQGRDALTLLRDGAVKSLSIGFEPIEHTEATDDEGNLTVTRTKIRLCEVSVVNFPAYEQAEVTKVRSAPVHKENTMSDTLTRADLDEVRTSIEDLDREVRSLAAVQSSTPEPRGDVFASVGHLIKALAAGDDSAVRAYESAFEERTYTGSTTSDTIVKDAWVGNLVEVIKKRRPVLSTFATGTLPSEGMGVEYAVLKSDTTQVGVQAAEADDLAFGKVAIEAKTAPVITLGGWSSLSRQAIERANVGILDTMWEALAEKYGQASEAQARAVLTAALAWNGGSGPAALAEIEATLTTQDGIVAAVLDLAEHFENVGRSLDGVLVSKDVFLGLYGVAAEKRILQINGEARDKVGSITVQTAHGAVAGLPFKLLPNASAGTVVAYDATAIKTLEAPGAPFRLQDGNIVNLTQDFSLYGYLSAFVQKPAGLVKVVEESNGSTTTTTTTVQGG